MPNLATIYIDKERHKFSAAHFTIFSKETRERLHGHNFSVSARLVARVGANGMIGDYSIYKRLISKVCQSLDEYTLIPELSPFLDLETSDGYYIVRHGGDQMFFLQSDTLLLPLRNTTVEELSGYILGLLSLEEDFQAHRDVQELEVFVSSGPGQTGSTSWRR